jgi:hypothetical protein
MTGQTYRVERGESGWRSYEISDTIVQSIQTLFAAVTVGLGIFQVWLTTRHSQ